MCTYNNIDKPESLDTYRQIPKQILVTYTIEVSKKHLNSQPNQK